MARSILPSLPSRRSPRGRMRTFKTLEGALRALERGAYPPEEGPALRRWVAREIAKLELEVRIHDLLRDIRQGPEITRIQALKARVCGLGVSVDVNP